MLIAVGSVKGSPGVTTLSVGLAALWPRPGAVLLECDPVGGDLAARFGRLADHAGLRELADALRRGAGVSDGSEGPFASTFQRRLSIGVDAVLAEPGLEAVGTVRTIAAHGLAMLRRTAAAGTVLLDVGRLDPQSESLPLAAAADHVLLLARPDAADLSHISASLSWLNSSLSGQLWLVPAGDGRMPAQEVARIVHAPVLGVLPHHRWCAAALTGRMHVPRWRRLPLGKAIEQLAARLTALEPSPPPPQVVAPVVTNPRYPTRQHGGEEPP